VSKKTNQIFSLVCHDVSLVIPIR